MCLLFLSYLIHPEYPLIIAANRDEFFSRATAPLGPLDSDGTIHGGRDLQAGGTWLAVSKGCRLAALTNYRESVAKRRDAPSRGEILLEFLSGMSRPDRFVAELSAKAGQYNGFNLIVGDASGLYYLSNRCVGPLRLRPGLYGLSNHLLDTPWPKVLRGKTLLGDHLSARHPDAYEIFAVLADRWQPPDSELPTTGVGLAWERRLAPIFIDSADYGTRSSAVVTFNASGKVSFYEKSYPRTTEPGRHGDNVDGTVTSWSFVASRAFVPAVSG